MVKNRNIFLVYLLSLVTFGIYGIYWVVQTKMEMNDLGATIPTAWLIIIPIVNLFWVYKYCEGFSHVKNDDKKILWFILWIIPYVGIIMPGIIQHGLNKLSQ